MADYCNVGDKPKVYYKFGTSTQQIYESPASPIDVTVENFSTNTSNYSPVGYGLSGNSTNSGVPFSIVVRDYQIIDQGSGSPPDIRYILYVQRCQDSGLISYTNTDPASITINPAITCGASITNTMKSRLHIKKAGESTDIFMVEGDYPCTFKVACIDCPDGFCRCDCDTYPGYCCLDESLILGLINQLNS